MPPVLPSPAPPALRRRTALLLAGLALAVTLGVAQLNAGGLAPPSSAKGGGPQQVNLSALIDGLQNKYSRMVGLAADFTQVYAGADGRTVSEAGHLALKRPGKARWEYTQPERKLFVSDGR